MSSRTLIALAGGLAVGALALAVAYDTENHDGKCPETTLQAVADAWKNAMDLTVATLSEHA